MTTGSSAATSQQNFESVCTETGGSIQPLGTAGAITCVRNGKAIDGLVGDPDRVVELQFINVGPSDATISFDQLLAAAAD